MKIDLWRLAGTALWFVAFMTTRALADPVSVVNASFEAVALADGAAIPSVPGWTFSGAPTGTFDPAVAQYPGGAAADGENVSFINHSSPDTLAQVLLDNLMPNTRYVLEVEVGDRLDTTIGPYQVQLLAGGVVLAADGSVTPPDGGFATVTVEYTASASDPQLGLPLEIRLVGMGGSGIQVNFDNVRLSATLVSKTAAPAASHVALFLLLAGLTVVGTRKLRVIAK